MSEGQRERPMLEVVRGNPTDAELAALVAAVAGRTAARASVAGPGAPTAWNAPAARLRPPGRPGPDAWRRSALPR